MATVASSLDTSFAHPSEVGAVAMIGPDGWKKTTSDQRAVGSPSPEDFEFAALAARLSYLDAAIDNMSQALCMFDPSGRLLIVNRRFSDVFRVAPQAIKEGCTYRELLGLCADAGTLSGAPETYLAATAAAIGAGKSKNIRWELRDGRTLSVIDQPIQGGYWITTYLDITSRRQAELERDQAKELSDLIFESVSSAIFLKDADTRTYLAINRAAERQMGRLRSDVLGKSIHDVHSAAAADLIVAQDEQALRAGSEQFFENRLEIGGVQRLTTGRRLLLRDHQGNPKYLLAVVDDVTERKRDQERIEYLARNDVVTGLPNRAELWDRLDAALAGVDRGGRVALHYLDLDHFKRVNDTLGHLVGDELLKRAAERLRGCLRKADFIARIGGDEFAVLQTQFADASEIAALASRLSKCVEEPFDLGHQKGSVGVSIGISIAPADATERDQLLRAADLALYAAKEQARGTYCFYQKELNTRMRARQQLEADLRDALANEQFELYYQPIVHLSTNRVACCEALLRWHHPQRGLVMPNDFIPIAEETGLIVPIGEWVLRKACADAAEWVEDVRVAVNVSAAQIKGGRLAPLVVTALAGSGLTAGRLELEITESVLMHDTAATLAALHELHRLGVRISMDDFGTGYSSLSYLRSFPFDKIKIDRSFIENVSDKNSSMAIVEAVTSMAQRLGMTTTAEGVETDSQRLKVAELGCTEMQGYFFSRPQPASELHKMPGIRAAAGAV